jgi:hypothetical protein
MKATHRIYLEDRQAPRLAGRGTANRLRQTSEPTETYYEINATERLEALGRRWFRVTGTSRGRAFTALWLAVMEDSQADATTDELGARMRRVSRGWYVEATDVDLKLAEDLRRANAPMSGLQAAALLVATGMMGLELLVLNFGLRFGSHTPDVRSLSVGAAVMMVSMLVLDVVRRQVR